MEKRRSSHKKHKQEARQPCVGLETAVLWGGALAIAGLTAAFTLNKIKIRRRRSDRDKEEDKGSNSQVQGLPLILQNNPTEKHSLTGHGIAKMESCKSVSTQSLILEKKAELCICNDDTMMLCNNGNQEIGESCHQEILVSDNSAQESITSSEDCSNLEELTLIMNESGEVLQLLKTMEVEKDEEQYAGEEDDDDDDDESEENTGEEEEGRWEVRGSSSVECDNEAVWAEEVIEISSPEFVDHGVEKTEEETRINGTRENPISVLNEIETYGEQVKAMKDEDERGSKWRTRVQSAMAFLLLLSLLLYLFSYSEGWVFFTVSMLIFFTEY